MMLGMWVFMLVCNLLTPAVMIFYGRLFMKNPPREVNALFGYRTARSRKSQEAWGFAQRYMGELWRKVGAAMVPLAVLGQALTLLCPGVESMCLWSLVPTVLEITVMTATLIPVEQALKKNFDENGNRR